MATILLAEDDPSLRALIRLTLDSGRLTIVEVEDGTSALAAARSQRPDLIFLDRAMPGLSGVEVCRALRSDPATAGARIVMVTARTRDIDPDAALAAGVDEFITKPFSPAALLDKVRDVLGPEALF